MICVFTSCFVLNYTVIGSWLAILGECDFIAWCSSIAGPIYHCLSFTVVLLIFVYQCIHMLTYSASIWISDYVFRLYHVWSLAFRETEMYACVESTGLVFGLLGLIDILIQHDTILIFLYLNHISFSLKFSMTLLIDCNNLVN